LFFLAALLGEKTAGPRGLCWETAGKGRQRAAGRGENLLKRLSSPRLRLEDYNISTQWGSRGRWWQLESAK